MVQARAAERVSGCAKSLHAILQLCGRALSIVTDLYSGQQA